MVGVKTFLTIISLLAFNWVLPTEEMSLVLEEKVETGSTYVIRSYSFMDDCVSITPDGKHIVLHSCTHDVTQKWTVEKHPTNATAFKLSIAVYPDNDLSGFEKPPEKRKPPPAVTFEAQEMMSGKKDGFRIIENGTMCLTDHGQNELVYFEPCQDYLSRMSQAWALEKPRKL